MCLTRLKDNEEALVKACQSDLGKGSFETLMTEIDWCTNDIIFVCKNLSKWAKDERAPDIPLTLAALSPKIRKDPLGCVLVIGFEQVVWPCYKMANSRAGLIISLFN